MMRTVLVAVRARTPLVTALALLVISGAAFLHHHEHARSSSPPSEFRCIDIAAPPATDLAAPLLPVPAATLNADMD